MEHTKLYKTTVKIAKDNEHANHKALVKVRKGLIEDRKEYLETIQKNKVSWTILYFQDIAAWYEVLISKKIVVIITC